MSSERRARVLAAAAAAPSPTRADIARRNRRLGLVAAASGVAAFAIFASLASSGRWIGLGGDGATSAHAERSLSLVVVTAGGAIAVAAAALRLALSRGRSMLGRGGETLLLGAVSIPIALFAWKLGSTLAFDYPMTAWPERPGLRCFALSLIVAAGPLAAFLAIRRSAPLRPALHGAILGLAAGACSWVGVDLWCPVAYVPHLLLGHVLPLLVLAAAGAWLGSLLLSPRPHRSPTVETKTASTRW